VLVWEDLGRKLDGDVEIYRISSAILAALLCYDQRRR